MTCHEDNARRRCRGGLVLLAALAALSGTAQAAVSGPLAGDTLQLAQASGSVTLDEAVSMVRERTGGRVLRAETRQRDGRVVHRILVLLDDERVRTYHVDAETGRIR